MTTKKRSKSTASRRKKIKSNTPNKISGVTFTLRMNRKKKTRMITQMCQL